MTWKTSHRSLYYLGAPAPDDPVIIPKETALLVIDIQNTYLERPERAGLSPDEQKRYDLWTPFHTRMHSKVIPNTAEVLRFARVNGIECLFARIACHTADGRDRSLSQKMPGWNNLLLPKHENPSQIVPALQAAGDEFVITKPRIQRSLCISVIGLGIFYALVSWCAVSAYPTEGDMAAKAFSDGVNFFLTPIQQFVGNWAFELVFVLILTCSFACGMAFHNTASRCMYSLGREGVLPKSIAETHDHHKSPHKASAV